MRRRVLDCERDQRQRLAFVLDQAAARTPVEVRQEGLRTRMPGLRERRQPARRLLVIDLDAFAREVELGELELGVLVAEEGRGLLEIACRALGVGLEAARLEEIELGGAGPLGRLGLGEGVDFREAFPSIAYSKITSNEPLPFPDDAFEVSTANAVLEHVGSIDNQRRFVDELVRVARKAFITVPHRFFPVEHHTKTPLLHFTDTTFRAACRVTGKTRWLEQENLILMSKSHLQSLAPRGSIVRHTGIPLGPFSSNLLLFFEKP
mgnify:CR=1 FL=1